MQQLSPAGSKTFEAADDGRHPIVNEVAHSCVVDANYN